MTVYELKSEGFSATSLTLVHYFLESGKLEYDYDTHTFDVRETITGKEYQSTRRVRRFDMDELTDVANEYLDKQTNSTSILKKKMLVKATKLIEEIEGW